MTDTATRDRNIRNKILEEAAKAVAAAAPRDRIATTRGKSVEFVRGAFQMNTDLRSDRSQARTTPVAADKPEVRELARTICVQLWELQRAPANSVLLKILEQNVDRLARETEMSRIARSKAA